eukprot:CAMPEP_0173213468 /NCGR_PEP_ID=MMETSP1141-20130122/25422_1 /TAXON_ID=483371 /ORGANISM="non described non described, Strain CCMP2298" /LENGTH=56 /DNA_ID=CAMNT_0014140701 /DNA_START=55 /DNA_END=222 /DNA_ORIENTATION=-
MNQLLVVMNPQYEQARALETSRDESVQTDVRYRQTAKLRPKTPESDHKHKHSYKYV